MNSLLLLATLFLIMFVFGSAILLPFLPHKTIGKSFPQFYYAFLALLSGLVLWALHRLNLFASPQIVIVALPLWLTILTFAKNWHSSIAILSRFYAIFALIMLILLPYKLIFHTLSIKNYVLPFSLLLIASIFLAFHILCMIFGHWYLVNRELPIIYLKNTIKSLIYVSYARVIACGVSIFVAYTTLNASQFLRLTDMWGHGIFFWGRMLTGLAVPLLVAHLSYESAKIGSNQSATGILYAGNIFVLMGEIMALYLFTLTGVVF